MLDAELVAIDRDKANELKSFQELSTRARGAIAASEVRNFSPCTTSSPCCVLVERELYRIAMLSKRWLDTVHAQCSLLKQTSRDTHSFSWRCSCVVFVCFLGTLTIRSQG